jgi:DNA-directed RNA polymerase specialized sigma24 family protein
MSTTSDRDSSAQDDLEVPLDPEVARALAAAPWNDIFPKLLRFAVKQERSRERGRDVAHEAYVRVRLGHRRWNVQAQPDLLVFLCGVARSIGTHAHEAAGARHEISLDESADPSDGGPTSAPNPERLLEQKERLEAAAARRRELRARFADGDLEAKLLDLGDERGDETAAQLAARFGVVVRDVYNANARIERVAEQIRGVHELVGGAVLERREPIDPELARLVAMSPSDVTAELVAEGFAQEELHHTAEEWTRELQDLSQRAEQNRPRSPSREIMLIIAVVIGLGVLALAAIAYVATGHPR